MPRLYLDLETYNEQPISGGSYRYAETVEVTLFAYAIDDQPAKVWDRANKEPMPEDLKAAIKDPKTVFIAHNSMFDRVQLATLSPRFADPKNWEDTMVKAYLHGLPGKLEHLCDLFGLSKDKAKDKDGKRLVQMFCMPHDAWKIRRCTKETHPEDWERFVNYARLDVEAMRELDRLLPKRNTTQTEMSLWHLDQKINDRGFGVDTELVEAAIIAVDREQKELKKRTLELTEGELSSTTKRDAFLLQILKQYGIELDDARASTIEKLLDDESLPVGLKGLLETRLSATTSSTAKYKKFKQVVCKDGRVRGGLQFSGAARTRRNSGRLVQPQNFPRPSMKFHEVESGIEALKAGVADVVGFDVMKLTSSALRGCIVPSRGKKLVVADLSNIEGRDQAWLANEQWKLKAFKKYDTFVRDDFGNRIPDGSGDFLREGHDLYAIAYGKMFGVTPQSVMEDKKAGGKQRQVGKTAELACLSAETRVLTEHGIRPILEVKKTDRLWDGVDWVKHDGVVPRGEKITLHCCGIGATEDHKFHAGGEEWIPWGDLLRMGGNGEYPVYERREPTYDILNAGTRTRFSIVSSNDTKVVVHNCGYGGGVGSFVTFALSFNLDLNFLADSAYDKIDPRILAEAEGMWEWAVKKHRTLDLEKKTFIVMDSFKRQWREAHPNIATLWDLLEQGARLAIANKGEKFKIGKCEFDYTGKWLFLRLPSGRYLCYPQAAVDDKGQLSFMGVNQFTKKWGKIKTYGGKIYENCLAGSTLVCTNRGLIPITEIKAEDKLWDGTNWVSHKGPIYRGERETIEWLGFRVTPNHRIFDGSLFRSVTASGVSATLAALKWARNSVHLPSFDQGTETTVTQNVYATVGTKNELIYGSYGAVKVCVVVFATLRKYRDVLISIVKFFLLKPSVICGVTAIQASHDVVTNPPATSTKATVLAGYECMSHGEKIAENSFCTPCSLKIATTSTTILTESTTTEITNPVISGSSLVRLMLAIKGRIGSSPIKVRNTVMQLFVKNSYLIGPVRTLSSTIFLKVVRLIGLLPNTIQVEKVYDILDAGPNNRFMVQTELGPLVVHNCCQSVARDIMLDNMPLIEEAGYEIVLSVHDELITEAPDDPAFNAEHLSSLLSRNPSWAPDIPLAAAGFESYRYRKD